MKVAIMPAILFIVFVLIYIARRKSYRRGQAISPA